MALLKRKRSGLGDAMEVVTRFVNACNRHDADGVYACLHPDFDSIQPMYPSRNFRGADQVRRNWQAIFDAEPGFRLTVLRSAAVDDTIWLELHGAGRDAEVAGVFVMGVQGDRIRWARIYSALVEPVPAGVVDESASGALREVPPYQEEGTVTANAAAPAGPGEVVEESLIAPVLDMERSGRRRRRSRHSVSEDAGAAPQETAAEGDVTVVNADAASVDVSDADAVIMVDAAPGVDVTLEVEPGTEVVVVRDTPAPAQPADDTPEAAAAAEDTPAPEAVEDTPAPVPADDTPTDDTPPAPAEAADTPPPAAADTPLPAATDDDHDSGPATEAVDMVTVTEDERPTEPTSGAEEPLVWDAPPAATESATEPEPEPDPEPDPVPEPPRRLFGRKRP